MSDGQKKYDRFGRYLILDHLIDGGMAKICRARYLGEQADKVVAIKMVQPQFSQDAAFKTMFMDEIKVTFGLLHPNIIQTYDYGYHTGQLYVAMEYCDGRNLKEYLDKLRDRKFVFPVEISVYIITQVCQALHYAHTLTDKLTGKEYNIVHRDISPHNIMLTFDGAVKVIDFGIAKANTNSEATQAGTIKGKLSYLAPEYLEGKNLDARYDEFAVGITLWEMLCSRKLFKAPNDLAVLKKIQECKVEPPSKINPNVPKELDEIVLKSLSRDRSKRYENMDQMNRALMKFLYSHFPDFNATDLSYFAKELFKEEIRKDREKLMEFGKIDLKIYLDDLKREQTGGVAPAPTPKSNDSSKERIVGSDSESKTGGRNQVLDFGFDQQSSSQKTAQGTRVVNRDEILKKNSTRKVNVGEVDKKGELQLGATHQKKKLTSGPTKTFKSDSTGLHKNPSKGKTGTVSKDLSAGAGNLKNIAIAIIGVIALSVVGYFKFGNSESPQEVVTTNANKVQRQVAQTDPQKEDNLGSNLDEMKIYLTNFDKYKQRAFVNGAEVGVSILGEIKITSPGDYTLRIQSQGQEHFVTRVKLGTEAPLAKVKIPAMQYAVFGYLVNSRECVVGKLSFNLFGEDRTEDIPIKVKGGLAFPIKIGQTGEPVPTEYTVFYQKAGEDIQRKLTFTMKFENDSIDICNAIYKQSE